MSLSNTSFLVRLPSGNDAVYDVQPQHINGPESELNERAIQYGKQLAVCFDGVWHQGKIRIDDARTVALIGKLPKAFQQVE